MLSVTGGVNKTIDNITNDQTLEEEEKQITDSKFSKLACSH